MRWSPNYYLKGTAWPQPSWREERPSGRVFMPVSACLSFDGKTWEPIDSLANEPQTGQPNRPPK